MSSSYIKLHLSPEDFPADVELLQEAICQLASLLRQPTWTIDIPGVKLTAQEKLLCQYLATHSQITRKALFPTTSGFNAHVCKLRNKLAVAGIEISKGERRLNAQDRHKLDQFAKQSIADPLISPFPNAIPCTRLSVFMQCRMPSDVNQLRHVLLQLLKILRGNPESVNLPLSVSEKIVLSSLIAKEKGSVSRERIFVALYTPFEKDPRCSKIIDIFLSRLRRKLESFEINISTDRHEGFILGNDSRERLLAHLSPASPLAPRQQL